jgi:hypothetical protein
MYNISNDLILMGYAMEEMNKISYQSNFSLGIWIAVTALLYVGGNMLLVFYPLIAFAGMLSGLFSVVIFLFWLYHSYRNLLAFNTQGLAYSPGFAIGSWFIPLVNIALPFIIFQELWKASNPLTKGTNWKRTQASFAIILWWISFFLIGISGVGMMDSSFMYAYENKFAHVDPFVAYQAFSASLFFYLSLALNVILLIWVVVHINDRQNAKAEKLGLV